MGEIPIVNIGKLKAGSVGERSKEVAAMKRALDGPGFMYLSNTSVDAEPLFKDMHRFFALPFAEKSLSPQWSDPEENSGYVAPGGEELDEDSGVGDPKEAYDMNLDHLMSTRWAQTRAKDYWRAIYGLTEDVLSGYASVLGLEDKADFLLDAHAEQWNTLSLLHYLPGKPGETGADYRAGPHTDYGTITLLVQDSVGGLQLLDRISGRWVDAPPIEGTVVCNTADLMMRWTNDKLPSTLHRVVGPDAADFAAAAKSRYSIIYFVNPNKGTVIENLLDGVAPRYPPVTSRDYLVSRLSATFDAASEERQEL